MSHKLMVIAALLALCLTGWAEAAKKTERIAETHRFTDPGAENRLIIDNIWGDITVTGADGDEVRVRAVKTVRARDADDFARAEREIVLDVTRTGDLLELFVDAPFREREGRRHRSHRWPDDYEVRFDFEVQVPRGTHVELRTINDGDISVADIDGDYDVNNINGGIDMRGIGGSGEAYALNHDVTVDFTRNPTRDSRFGSLNGDVRLRFLPGLSADFYLKTFNGEFFSDFPVDYLPAKVDAETERTRSGYVYRVNRRTAVRAGDGGPDIALDMFNGDAFLLEEN